MDNPQTKLLLIILDGWGIGNKTKSDLIYIGNTQYLKALKLKYPNSQLLACGEDVGLPDGQMGNSEVGHLNIGAGRVLYQDLVKINRAIKDNTISSNKVLIDAFNYALENDKSVHLLGLVSNGGVHSSEKHLYKLCDIAKEHGLKKVFIHAFTDGRDTDPQSGLKFISDLEEHLKNSTGEIATLCGRYYAMDRDKRWERIKIAYDMLVHGKGNETKSIHKAIKESYDDKITDEFIKPIVKVGKDNKPVAVIQPGDVVLCFNFRTDRLREMTTVLTQEDFSDYEMQTMDLYYLTMTCYDESFKKIHVLYEKDNIKNTLGEVLARDGKKQVRIAETEKYPHVTFFFSGGREKEFENEKRILIPSPKVATYDLQPEMSAFLVKDEVIKELKKKEADFICVNFANGDMVGHTGVYNAILKAVAVVDECVKEIVETSKDCHYIVMIISDHGNADHVLNDDGSPNTAHSLNPVPCILVSDKYSKINDGVLADIAPTILTIMGLEIPSEMTGKVLV